MNLAMVGLDEIRTAATRPLVFTAVQEALIAHAEGRTLAPPPVHLMFPDANGDCHVKAGHVIGARHFTVKVATSFYDNPQAGLSSNNGAVLVMSATTGAPLALLADDGWLTAWRTAAAGALITHALTPADVRDVAILGTGVQARLQIEWLHALRPLDHVKVWGRRAEGAERLSNDLNAVGINADVTSLADAASTACVITATAAATPLAPAEAFADARHITAIGADMPGKNELPPSLFSAASTIATDDHTQCLDHGDFGSAVRAGHVRPDCDTEVGTILRGPYSRPPGSSIADLTGIGVADASVASAVLDSLAGIAVR
jgi:ornithine cyclodeaminase